MIETPDVYQIDEATYFADPALSQSGAKRLLPPSCPAIFKHERDDGRPDTRAFDLGHAAHKLVLGAGAPIVAVDADDWRTKAAKEQRDAIRADGGTPLLRDEYEQVSAMADAIRAHPIASILFDPEHGTPEQSMFWRDQPTDVMLRARLDWLPNDAPNGRLILADYKTAVSANPGRFAKSAADYGYHQQHAWYVDGALELGFAEDVQFVFVVQEKTAPYLVSVVQLDREAVDIGRALNRQAIDLYAECAARDEWPSYGDDVALISLPAWYVRTHEGSAA